ncbi:MAG: hypothetical protein COZ11_05585 [Deltaproteobacteria bacterium CG_4_10_14_3_um_filter_51_14]|nr:MAG: hypothetical protein COZ11_05585 [Deltaproteobacteria bacterium CG_4_10_14_3_um_filter_51_14]
MLDAIAKLNKTMDLLETDEAKFAETSQERKDELSKPISNLIERLEEIKEKLFKRQCSVLAIPVPTQESKAMLRRLSILTPGDFAAVARQNRFRPIETPQAFLLALEQECLVKEDGKSKVIGFL